MFTLLSAKRYCGHKYRCGDMLQFQIMTSGIISGDQAAVKRIFSLISRPLDDFKDLYYPSFAEWVSCKVCWLQKDEFAV